MFQTKFLATAGRHDQEMSIFCVQAGKAGCCHKLSMVQEHVADKAHSCGGNL